MEVSEIISEIKREKNDLEISFNYKLIQDSRQRLKKCIMGNIIFSKPIISREEVGIIYPNTINIIQGKSGVHKSRLVENLCCVFLSKISGKSFLGFSANCSEKYTVLYVDTERNQKDQYPYALQKIILNSGYSVNEEIKNFDFISLIEITREARFDALKEYLEKMRRTISDHIVIVLDVLTDIIKNFNDPNESMKLIDLMNMMINSSNVTFIGIIHENPNSGDKARGHLGTEVFNKSSTVLQIGMEKDNKNSVTDLIKVSYLKCRNTRRQQDFHLVYSEISNGLEIADETLVKNVQDSQKIKAQLPELKKFLAQNLHESQSKELLFEKIIAKFNCSARIVEERLKQLTDSKEIFNNKFGFECFLEKIRKERQVFYCLSKPNKLI